MGKKVRAPKETKETGITERLILTMADDVANVEAFAKRVRVQFDALAKSVGVNVANAFVE